MANPKQNIVILGLIIVILTCMISVIKLAIPKRYRPPDVDWTCEACGYQFINSSALSPSKCSRCGKEEAVRSTYYECQKCSNVFEAYRAKIPARAASRERPEGMPPEMEALIKTPGGEWTNEMTEKGMKIMEELSCPKCGNRDRASLKYSPPSAKQ